MWYFGVDDEVGFTSPFTPPARKAMGLGLARVFLLRLVLALCFTQKAGDIFKQPRNAKTTARKLGKNLTKVLPDDRRSSLIKCDD